MADDGAIEAQSILDLCDGDRLEGLPDGPGPARDAGGRLQAILGLSSIVITVTGFSGVRRAQTIGSIAKMTVVSGLVLVLIAAAVIGGVLRLRWSTQELRGDAREHCARDPHPRREGALHHDGARALRGRLHGCTASPSRSSCWRPDALTAPGLGAYSPGSRRPRCGSRAHPRLQPCCAGWRERGMFRPWPAPPWLAPTTADRRVRGARRLGPAAARVPPAGLLRPGAGTRWPGEPSAAGIRCTATAIARSHRPRACARQTKNFLTGSPKGA